MKKHLQQFKLFLREAEDPTYYQETFYFTVLISMNKNVGGSRDETKNDIRALPEILTVTLVEPEKGGVQRDIGTKYLSTLKIHVRKPRDISKRGLMRRVVLHVNNLRGISVLRYKEKKPKPRKKAFLGTYSITELDYQKVRRQKAGEYAKEKANYLSTGPQKKGGTPYTNPYPKKRGKSAPPIVGATGGAFGLEETQLEETTKAAADLNHFDRLYEDILITIGQDQNDLMAFDVQDELNPQLWSADDALYPGVKAALMDVVEEFVESLDLDILIEDVIVTGSIANYNWSKFSDIDVHILVNFESVDKNRELVKRFFDAVRSNWNKLHNIYVKGHEVEIYLQDVNEPHISTGVYSMTDEVWRVRPKKIKPYLDKHTATKKMKYIAREIDKLQALFERGLYEKAYDKALVLKEKIKRMRQSGLQASGIYSPENLAFKMLRRSGDIEMLFSVFTKAYDRLYSVDQ